MERNDPSSLGQHLGLPGRARALGLPGDTEEMAVRRAQFLEDLYSENDRSAAVIGAAIIEESLIDLVNGLAADGRSVDSIKYSPRIVAQLAYELGLIDKDHWDQIKIVSKIRSDFAHSWQGLSFDDPAIAKQVNRLRITSKGSEANVRGNPRLRFCMVVSTLWLVICIRAYDVRNKRPKLPEWTGFQLDEQYVYPPLRPYDPSADG